MKQTKLSQRMGQGNKDLEFLLEKLKDTMSGINPERTTITEGENSFYIDELAIISYFDGGLRAFAIITPTVKLHCIFHHAVEGREYYEVFTDSEYNGASGMHEESLLSQGLNGINNVSLSWHWSGHIATRYMLVTRELENSSYNCISIISIGELLVNRSEIVRHETATRHERQQYGEQALISLMVRKRIVNAIRIFIIFFILLMVSTIAGIFYPRKKTSKA